MPPRWIAIGAALAAACMCANAALAQGCAMCGSAAGADDSFARALNWSILFLLAAPYTLLAVAGGWLFLTYRRAAGRSRASVVRLPWARPTDLPKEV